MVRIPIYKDTHTHKQRKGTIGYALQWDIMRHMLYFGMWVKEILKKAFLYGYRKYSAWLRVVIIKIHFPLCNAFLIDLNFDAFSDFRTHKINKELRLVVSRNEIWVILCVFILNLFFFLFS